MTAAADAAPARVLLVEDHAQLRRILERTLQSLGYEVRAFALASEALAALEAGVAADVLLTDVRMPGPVNGLQLADWVRRERPAIRVLLQTGYADAPTGDFPVLRKPFTPEELHAAVERLTGRDG